MTRPAHYMFPGRAFIRATLRTNGLTTSSPVADIADAIEEEVFEWNRHQIAMGYGPALTEDDLFEMRDYLTAQALELPEASR